jgi:TonB family protein
MLFWLASSPARRPPEQYVTPLFDRRLIAPARKGPGGGGGQNSPIPANRGRLPPRAALQRTPLMVEILNQNPRLPAAPTILAPPDVEIPDVSLQNFGNPFAPEGPPSGGPGKKGGSGEGPDGGVGNDPGPSFGSRRGTITAGPRGRISVPMLLFKVEPEYSEAARKAKFQGTVVLAIDVDVNGLARNIRVREGLGLGLDEQAIDAVRKWRFRPGMRDGRPVVMPATIEVSFRLL